MIITLIGANFADSNIGTSNQWRIVKSLKGVTCSNSATTVNKGSAYSATFTVTSGYTFSSATVTMGGIDKTSSLVWNNEKTSATLTLATTETSGNIYVTITALSNSGNGGNEEPETPDTPDVSSTLPLTQGYIDKGTVNNELNTRVRSDGLASGAFSVEVNSEYLIRAIYEHTKADLSDGGTAIVVSADAKTSYSGGEAGKYYAFTFCKSDATKSLSPSEDIIKNFSGIVVPIQTASSETAGTDVTYTLRSGAHVQNNSSIFEADNRVTTTETIKGKFTVTVNSGYAIRAVYEYNKQTGDTAGVMAAETSTDRTTFTSTNANKWYGVTFTKSGDAANDSLSPTENIVASWKYV